MKKCKTYNKEVWVDVVNYKSMYQISSKGRVRSLSRKIEVVDGNRVYTKTIKGRIRKLTICTGGYHTVSIRKNGKTNTKRIHQLMAEAFLSHTPNGMGIVVDHIDTNRLNNELSNLRLISARENTLNTKSKKTSKYSGVSWSKKSNKWVVYIYKNGKNKNLGYFLNEDEAGLTYLKAVRDE